MLLFASVPVAEADEHEEWELLVGSYPGPLQGACGALLSVHGGVFPAQAEVAIGRVETSSFVELTRVIANDRGAIRLDLADAYPADCAPGLLLHLAARVVSSDGFMGDGAGRFEVIATQEMRAPSPGKLTLSIPAGADCTELTIAGAGFPPGIGVALSIGAADAFAHNFAVIEVIHTDGSGAFSTTTRFFSRSDCDQGQQFAIFATAAPSKVTGTDPEEFPRASVVYTAGQPIPAVSGNAGVAAGSAARGALPHALAALALVAAARWVTGLENE